MILIFVFLKSINGIILWLMPHFRARLAASLLRSQAKLWPVVGLLGPRQCGKTTLFHALYPGITPQSFDDAALKEEAKNSPETFLQRRSKPLLIDEAQKVPELFDAIKLLVDRKRVLGSFLLTGSSQFSSRIGVRESLTGRISLNRLFPMTMRELQKSSNNLSPTQSLITAQPPIPVGSLPKSEFKCRFSASDVAQSLKNGGMPVPAFMRDPSHQNAYWVSWLETTLYRDLSIQFTKSYDPDFAFSLIRQMVEQLKQGELPTLKHFKQSSVKVRRYLQAMEDIFLLSRFRCHEAGVGKDVWIFFDSGLLTHLSGEAAGDGMVLSLVRHKLWNEWLAHAEYGQKRFERLYFKSQKGMPIDGIIHGTPIKIITTTNETINQRGWHERALRGAMKKIGSKHGILITPLNSIELAPKKIGISLLPWGIWS
jgi:predicted AAA+ superfamily ATPase